MGTPRVSLCMIVKDEAAWIARCLASVQSLVSEMIVLDTGSGDDTVVRAQAAGARVESYAWVDDFSAARNASIGYARGDWILVLDADEVLDAHGRTQIAGWLAAPTADMAELIQTNYSTESQMAMWRPNTLTMPEAAGQPGFFDIPLVRLFRNDPSIRFVNPIHEMVLPAGRACARLPVRMHHYGQVRPEGRTRKREQYYQLVAKKYAATPQDPQCVFEMAIASYETNRWDDAQRLFRAAIAAVPQFMPCYVALAHICCARHEYAEAEAVCAAGLQRYPDDVPLAIWRVRSLLGQQRLGDAGGLLQRLSARAPQHPEVLKCQAQHALVLEMPRMARTYVQCALAQNPHDAQAREWLAECEALCAAPAERAV